MKFTDVIDSARGHQFEFTLWPTKWKDFPSNMNFDWKIYNFDRNSVNEIPLKRGVYGFLLKPGIASNIHQSYLFYIGITPKRTLRARYQDYLRDQKNQSGRPKIVDFLCRYDGHIQFTCSTIQRNLTLELVENELLGSLIPPLNEQFPAVIRKEVKAFRR